MKHWNKFSFWWLFLNFFHSWNCPIILFCQGAWHIFSVLISKLCNICFIFFVSSRSFFTYSLKFSSNFNEWNITCKIFFEKEQSSYFGEKIFFNPFLHLLNFHLKWPSNRSKLIIFSLLNQFFRNSEIFIQTIDNVGSVENFIISSCKSIGILFPPKLNESFTLLLGSLNLFDVSIVSEQRR